MLIKEEACGYLLFQKRSKSQFTMGFFHIIICWRLIQIKNMIMQILTLLFLRVFNNLLKKYFIIFLCEDCPTGSAYFTYICLWLSPWRRFWICTHPLRAIFMCYCPWLFHFSGISSHYQFCYLFLDLFCPVGVANHTDWTGTKGLYIPRKFSEYSVYTSTFSTVFTPNKAI